MKDTMEYIYNIIDEFNISPNDIIFYKKLDFNWYPLHSIYWKENEWYYAKKLSEVKEPHIDTLDFLRYNIKTIIATNKILDNILLNPKSDYTNVILDLFNSLENISNIFFNNAISLKFHYDEYIEIYKQLLFIYMDVFYSPTNNNNHIHIKDVFSDIYGKHIYSTLKLQVWEKIENLINSNSSWNNFIFPDELSIILKKIVLTDLSFITDREYIIPHIILLLSHVEDLEEISPKLVISITKELENLIQKWIEQWNNFAY